MLSSVQTSPGDEGNLVHTDTVNRRFPVSRYDRTVITPGNADANDGEVCNGFVERSG